MAKKFEIRFKLPKVSKEQKEIIEAINGVEARKILEAKYSGFKHVATKTMNN